MMDGQKEKMAFQEMTEAHLECEEPTSVDMEPEVEHWEVPKEDAGGSAVGTRIWPQSAARS
jgi:hypothetical protein